MAFSSILVLLFLVAILFVAYPFVVGSAAFGASSSRRLNSDVTEANVGIFRDQQAQLQRQLDSDEINQVQYEQLLADAKQLLLSNTADSQTAPVQAKSLGLWLLAVLVLSLPLAAMFAYNQLGAEADEEILALIAQNDSFTGVASAAADDSQKAWREALDRKILQRVKQRPENIYYWAMLAQGALAKGDVLAASQYFASAVEVQPEDGFLQAQYAESLYLVAGNRFTSSVERAMDRAFAVDSNNPTILGLKGIQSFENNELPLAITYWQRAMQTLGPDSPTSKALQLGVERAQSLLGKPAKTPSVVIASGTEISVLVSLDPSIIFQPNQLVFVAAVRDSGLPMPLAARKLTAADLPALVTLSDSDALMAGQNLSSVDRVRLVARLSATGSATPQSGDWEMVSNAVKLDDSVEKIELQISTQRP